MPEHSDASQDPWLTLAEIATELRVNPATVRLWVSRGQLNASRAGQRKWLVRRSELDRMLAASNRATTRVDGGTTDNRSPLPPRPSAPERTAEGSAVEETAAPNTDSRHAIELVRIAERNLNAALDASRYAPPAPGYLDRIRAIADAFEHTASALRNAAATVGLSWNPRTTFGWHVLSYELKPDGNRPGERELWAPFDAAVEHLAIAFNGTDVRAVADGYAELRDTLLEITGQLEASEAFRARG